MITNTEIDFPNIRITNIGIVNSFDRDFQIFPRGSKGNDESFLLDELIIKEDMFSEAVFGSISFFDSSYIVDQLNLTSSLDSVYFTLYEDYHQYRIIDVNVASDLASKQVHGPVGTVNKVTIRFSSDSFVNKNFDTLFDANYIGKISKTSTGTETETETGTESAPPPGFDEAEFQANEAKMEGFVQHLMEKYNTAAGTATAKPLNADDTHNDIWVKTENFFYPLFKVGNNLRISQLMNYVCEYACYKKNPKAVNFFFWEDTEKWNFKCIESLLSDPIKGTYNLAGYRAQSENYSDTIVAMEVVSDTSPMKLYDGGAAFSEYIRVTPDWGNPYRGFMDSANSLRHEQVTYNYKDGAGTNTDEGAWKRIAPFSPFTDYILEKYKTKQDYSTVRISDLSYGFYSNAYNTKDLPWWNYYDFTSPFGYTGDKMALSEEKGGYDIHSKEDLFSKHPGSKEVSRIDSEYWQAQYDFSELPGAFLRTIYKDIKWALTDARTKYAEAKATKMQWDVYRNTICCDSASSLGANTFYAYLWAATEITDPSLPGAMYYYYWKQVELWPRTEIDQITDDSYEIIKSETTPFWFVFVSSPKFLSGQAYNLNELLNSFAPTQFENSNGNTLSVDAKGNQKTLKTLTIGPGVSIPVVDESSDVSADIQKYLTSYPSGYKMRAIGSYQITNPFCSSKMKSNSASSGQGGFNIGNTGAADRNNKNYYGGKIVQMRKVPASAMKNLVGFTSGSRMQQPYIYIFDSENAHDGKCDQLGCTGGNRDE
jgi:hypothetical protein